MAERDGSRVHEHWARLASRLSARFPAPAAGGAARGLATTGGARMASPSTGAPVPSRLHARAMALPARNERHDPVGVLRRKRRGDAGAQVSMTVALRQGAAGAIQRLRQSWSAQLIRQSLLRPRPPRVTAGAILHDGSAVPFPSGLTRRRATTARQTEGALLPRRGLRRARCVGLEAEYVNGLLGLPPRFSARC